MVCARSPFARAFRRVMSYATEADLTLAAGGPDRFVQLTDWDGDTVADADVVARALAAADAFIDMHLRMRNVQVDLDWLRANPTQSVKEIACDEAIYSIRKWREGVTEPEEKNRVTRAELLRQVNIGTLRLADNPSPRRAVFVDNCDDVSREKLKGQW